MVPGPWGTLFGLCTVIAMDGGTSYDIAEGREQNKVIDAKPGDRLVLDASTVVEISLDHRRYPILTVVEG